MASAGPLNSGASNSNSCLLDTHGLLSPGLERFFPAIEPGADPFLCERYAADLERIFQALSHSLQSATTDVSSLSSVIAALVEFSPLDGFKTTSLRSGTPIQVENLSFQDLAHKGRPEFLSSFVSYLRPLSRIVTAEFLITDLKIVSPSPVVVDITVRYDLVGDCGPGLREERVGEWSMLCEADKKGTWQIQKWRPVRESRVRISGPAFVDITAFALQGNNAAENQFSHGTDYWRGSIDAACGIDVYGNNGIAVGDFDGDGLDDFYVCQPSGLPNRLFRNRGDGTFEDVTEASTLGLLDGTASALFADFTNSGTQDLIIVRTSGPLLYLNRGKGKFELKPDAFRFAKPPSGTFTGIAAADYNRDGLLDVYFCLYAYYQGLSQYTHPQPYYDAQNGPPNFLMRNRGDGTFEDVTQLSGLSENNNRFTFACGWCDYDNDGWPDLYVANDFGRKNLYRNNGDGTFHDVATQEKVEDFGAGMSVSWFDYDNDGRQDLYVTDMYSAAGSRVTAQDVFLRQADSDVRAAYRKHAGGNSLFHNVAGSQSFADASGAANVRMGRWSWAADAWDFDHDGITDLYVTNGFISGQNQQDLASFFWRQIVARSLDSGPGATDYQLAWNAINELIRAGFSWNGYERNVFFLNGGDGNFVDAAGALGMDFVDDSRAFALADFDGDGRLEVILKNRTGPQLRVLRNDLNPIGKSVTLRLRGNKSNRDAIGAVVTLQTGPLKQVKFVQAGSGFLSQHTKDLSFGIGTSAEPVHATIQWPSGISQRVDNLPAQHLISIGEDEARWKATPFTVRRHEPTNPQPHTSAQVLSDHFESWLLEPLPALDFSLPDLSGKTFTLGSFGKGPLLLVLISSNCDASKTQLTSLSNSFAAFKHESVAIAAIHMDSQTEAIRALNRLHPVPFPVLLADPATAGVYSILYRYLFDKRRDIETPTSLLLNDNREIFKVNRGIADASQLLHDFSSAPATPESRLARALPFKGRYHGELPHRNFFTYGIAFIQSGYTDAALKCFQASLVRNPNYAAAHYNIGTVYLNKQMLPEAKASLERAVALDPLDSDALTNLGSVLGQQQNYDGALRCFQQALQVKPNHVVALQNLVMLDRMNGKVDEAQKAVENAIAADPNDGEFHFALGMLMATRDKFDDAQVQLERAVQLRPADPIALNNLGVVYLRLNQPGKAFDCFDRCMRLAPDYDRPFLNIASIYQQRGQLSQAQDVLKDFLKRHPDNSELSQALQSLR